MAYEQQLERLVGAKESMRQSIIAKGVDVPEDVMIEDLPEYIAQINGGSSIPDLSKVLTKDDFEIIQKIIGAGQASEKFSVGDEFLISYGSYTMPFEVVGFEPVEVEGGVTKPAINLLAKYTSETKSTWALYATTTYSASNLHSNITTTYQNKLDANFVECLAITKTQTYSRDGSTDVVYDKLFVPSMAQLGITDTKYNNAQQAATEGPAFTAYQDSDNAKRLRQAINNTSLGSSYWTRSIFPGQSASFGYVAASGALGYMSSGADSALLAACNLIGTS